MWSSVSVGLVIRRRLTPLAATCCSALTHHAARMWLAPKSVFARSGRTDTWQPFTMAIAWKATYTQLTLTGDDVFAGALAGVVLEKKTAVLPSKR